jgi:putative aldouronate transport system permease protein
MTAGRIAIYFVLSIVFLIMFYPFFYVVSLAVMPYEEYVRRSVHAFPVGFTALYFRQIFDSPELSRGFLISFSRTAVGVVLSVLVTSMAGYVLARRRIAFTGLITFLFLIPMFFNAGIIPTFLTVRALGLLNTFWALILPMLAAPMWVFIARAYYVGFPPSLIESVYLDGGGEFRIFWSIVWPTSQPIAATLAVMYGTFHWNEYFWSRILVQSDLWPATVHLYQILNQQEVLQGLGVGVRLVQQSFIAAVAAVLIVPVLVFYPFLQRFVVQGIMVGSVKG